MFIFLMKEGILLCSLTLDGVVSGMEVVARFDLEQVLSHPLQYASGILLVLLSLLNEFHLL